jgi:hypothetical protein
MAPGRAPAPHGGGEGPSGGTAGGDGGNAGRWLRRLLPGLAALALLAAAGWIVQRFSGAGAKEAAGAPAPSLEAWELLGCWSVRVEPWFVAAAEGDGRPQARFAPPEGGGVPRSFEPPDTVMLLPDSVDRWGRALPSYRAVRRTAAARAGRHLRWLVNGDTLWLVWSEGGTRAGLALRPSGDSLVGQARALSAPDSVDASAGASAARVNCSTGRREGRRPARPRR